MKLGDFSWEKWGILFLTFCAIFFLFVKPPIDPDLFWHLKNGQLILKTHQLPYADAFSFTFVGYRAADSWWLSEVIIFFLYSQFGLLFTSLFFAFLGGAIFLAVGFGAQLQRARWQTTCFAAFFGGIVSWPILGLRPQTISLFFFGLALIVICRFWRNPRTKLIFFLPLIFVFWANSHAGFILGLILVWLFWLGELGRFFWLGLRPGMRREKFFLGPGELLILAGVNFFSSLATIINPYGLNLWSTILNDASSPQIKKIIMEWWAPDFHTELGLIFFLMLLILAVLAYLSKKRIELSRFSLLIAFSFLALAAQRHISFFALLATPFLAEELSALPWRRLEFPYKSWAVCAFLFLFSFSWAYQLLPLTFETTGSLQGLALAAGYPYFAVEYLRSHPQERIFNYYDWGGYLIWQLSGGKTFIDGRMPGWKKGERLILTDYDKIINLKSGFEETINFWQIKGFLIPSDSPLARYLMIHPDWREVYRDSDSVIFARQEIIALGGQKNCKMRYD